MRTIATTSQPFESDFPIVDFFEKGVVALHLINEEGIILRVNQAELNLMGYTREEYVGHHIAEFHADVSVIDDILQRLARNETIQNYEARLRCKDGSIKHVLISSNVRWEDGRFVHTRCFTRDITDRKHAEFERERWLAEARNSKHRLEEKVTDLEKYHDAVVQRELQMMELEKKVVQLERELGMLKATPANPLERRQLERRQLDRRQSERRQCARVPLRCPSSVIGVELEKEEQGYISNLSEAGCTVEGHFTVQPNTDVALSMFMREEEQLFRVELALVRWVKAPFFGVEFVSMRQEQREHLRALLNKLEN